MMSNSAEAYRARHTIRYGVDDTLEDVKPSGNLAIPPTSPSRKRSPKVAVLYDVRPAPL